MTENETGKIVVDECIQLQRALGPGLLLNFGDELMKNGITRTIGTCFGTGSLPKKLNH